MTSALGPGAGLVSGAHQAPGEEHTRAGTCTHVCTHMYIRAHVHWDVHTCIVHVHTCTYAHTCVGMCTHIHVCTHMHAHIHTCTHMCTHVLYTCTHAHTYMLTHCAHMHTHARSGSHFIGELDSGPRVFPPLSAPAHKHSRGDPNHLVGRPRAGAGQVTGLRGQPSAGGGLTGEACGGGGGGGGGGPGRCGPAEAAPCAPQGRWPIRGSGAGALSAGCPWGRSIGVRGPPLASGDTTLGRRLP